MNCFARLIEKIGAKPEHHNEIHALLAYGDATYTTGGIFGLDVFANYVTECYRRWEVGGVGPPTMARLRQTLNSAEAAVARGN